MTYLVLLVPAIFSTMLWTVYSPEPRSSMWRKFSCGLSHTIFFNGMTVALGHKQREALCLLSLKVFFISVSVKVKVSD